MRVFIFFVISFAAPILGAPAQDLTEVLQKLPDLLEDLPKLPDEETPWQDVTCDVPSLKSKFNDPFKQWNDAKASEAFAAAYKNYKDKKLEKYGFSSTLFDFFHANPTINCENPTDVGCSAGTECGQGDWPNARVSAPAGYMIINSISFLHKYYQNQYNGLSEALNTIQSEIGTFTEIFSPQIDPMKDEKIMIDILMMGFGVFSAGAFNSWLKNLPYFDRNKNNLGVVKDTTNSWVTQGMNIIKDNKSALSALKVQNTMEMFLVTIVQEWQSATNKTLEHFMSKSPLDLLNLIVNGKAWDPSPKDNIETTKAEVRKTLYSMLTPYAWSLSNSGFIPFIATSDGLDGNKDDCNSYDPAKKYERSFSGDYGLFESNRLCSKQGDVVWLLSMRKNPTDRLWCKTGRPKGPDKRCQFTELGQLPGYDTIKDDKKWGFTRDQLVTAAMRGWKKNGKKNGYEGLDYSTPGGRDEILDHGIGAMGLVNIPVCSLEEALNNAKEGKETDNWPCN